MIIGSERDYHAWHILERFKEKGTPCFFLDTQAFPKVLKLSLTPKDKQNGGYLITPEGQRVALSDIRSVYWRYHHGVEVDPEINAEISYIIYREIDSALGSLFRNLPHVLWVNPPSAIDRHRYKTHQLFLMAQAGIPVPDTLVTNDPDAVKAFYKKHQGNLIYKPVSGGAHTSKVTPEDVADDRLKDLALSPVQFQECVDGVDIRVYLIGDDLFAAEIQAGTVDFRDNPDAPIVPVALPDEVAGQCRTLADLFEYRFTGIDIRLTPDGRYVFIEGNPSPMFVHFENVTGFPITQSLMTLLEKG